MSDSRSLRLLVNFVASDKLSGTLKSIVGLGQTGSEKLALMKKEARGLEKELAEVEKELRKGPSATAGIYDRQKQLTSAIEEANKRLEKQAGLVKALAGADRMQARGQALQSAGTQNIAGGVGILAPLALAAKGAADFQSGMTDIALKANLSSRETAALQGNILAAARAARQLPEAMRSGVDVLSGFGLDPRQATQMIGPIGKVATAYRAEIADLASASFANFSNLKVPIAQNARALEVMAAAGNAGAFEIKDMAQYFPSLTAQAQAFGQKGVEAVADLAAAAQIARKGTGDSASAATNLQNLLAKINTEETIKKFGKMGVDLPAALKKAYAQGKTPLEAIAEITNKTLGGKLDKISFLFGDMQAQQALRPLIQNMDEYRRIRADALASKGAVDAAFARRGQDAAVSAQQLIGNLQRMAITAGPVLLPPLVRLSEILLSVTDRVTGWMQANPGATKALIMLVAGIGVAKVGLGALQLAFGGLLGPMGTAWKLAFRAAPIVSSAFTAMRVAALMLGRGLLQAGAMMLANPIVLVIAAIVAVLGFAGYMVYKHWDKIKGAFSAAGAWLSGLGGTFMAYGRALLDGLVNGISSRVLAVKSMILGIGQKVAGWFRGVLGIHSPSRVFMGFGGFITDGLALGIERGGNKATRAAAMLAASVAAAASAQGMPQPPLLTPVLAENHPAAPDVANTRSTGGTDRASTIRAAAGLLAGLRATFDTEKAGGAREPRMANIASAGNMAPAAPRIVPYPMPDPRAQRLIAPELPELRIPRLPRLLAPAESSEKQPGRKNVERPRLAPLAPTRTASPGIGAQNGAATIHIGQLSITVPTSPGQKPQEIAEAVAAEFRKQAGQVAARQRSSYSDD